MQGPFQPNYIQICPPVSDKKFFLKFFLYVHVYQLQFFCQITFKTGQSVVFDKKAY